MDRLCYIGGYPNFGKEKYIVKRLLQDAKAQNKIIQLKNHYFNNDFVNPITD